jgi:hypothetical protein
MLDVANDELELVTMRHRLVRTAARVVRPLLLWCARAN